MLFFQQVERLKLFKSIPTLEEINALGEESLKADVICVDFENDTLVKIKMFFIELVKGLNSEPVTVIKKTAKLVRMLCNCELSGESMTASKMHGYNAAYHFDILSYHCMH